MDLNEALKDSSRGTASLSKLRIGRLLVVLQVALSVLLLAGAGLCVKTFRNLRAIPLGLQPEGVLLFTLDPPRLRYPEDRIAALMTALQERLNAIPGVSSASFNGGGGGTLVQSSSEISQDSCESRRQAGREPLRGGESTSGAASSKRWESPFSTDVRSMSMTT